MTEDEKRRRFNSALAEVDEFCRIFRLKRKFVCFDQHRRDILSLVIYRERAWPGNEREEAVFEVRPAEYDLGAHTPLWRIPGMMLTKLRRGPAMTWTDKTVSPAENGTVTVTTKRVYRVPKFGSVAELKLLLVAAGSEFALR